MTFWSDVLDLINQYGWGKSPEEVLEKYGGDKECLLTAMSKVSSSSRYEHTPLVSRRFVKQLIDTLGIGYDELADWNDSSETTWSDIESVLKTLHERELEKGEV